MKWLQHAYDSIGRRHRQRRHLAVLFQIPIAGADREHGISLNPPMVGDVKNGRRKRARHHLRRPRAKRNRMVGIRADGLLNRITDREIVGSSSRRGPPSAARFAGLSCGLRSLARYRSHTSVVPCRLRARTRLAHQGRKNGPRHRGAGVPWLRPAQKALAATTGFSLELGIELTCGWWTNIFILLQNIV